MSFESTKNYNNFRDYIKIKESLLLNYNGIDLSKIIASDLFGLIDTRKNINVFKFLYLPFIRIDSNKIRLAFKNHKTIISTFFKNRPDYTELINEIQNSIEDSIIVQINPHKKSYRLNLKAIFWIAKKVYQNDRIKRLNKRNSFYLVLRGIYACNQIDELDKTFREIDLKGKNYIPFNSAIGIEAILTQFFNKKGAVTFHIFHGLFGRYKLNIANDVLNGENINAQKILTFGEVTKDDLIRDFNQKSNQIIIAGNPKYPLKKISVKTTFKKCVVLNGFGYYDNTFEGLLVLLNNIAQNNSLSFYIKPHPSSNIVRTGKIRKFKNLIFLPGSLTIKNLLQKGKYDYAIAFNTVTYYECMYYDMICFRYSKNENLDFIGLDDKFFDERSFLNKILEFKNKEKDLINTSIESLLIKTIGLGINNYNEIINCK